MAASAGALKALDLLLERFDPVASQYVLGRKDID